MKLVFLVLYLSNRQQTDQAGVSGRGLCTSQWVSEWADS